MYQSGFVGIVGRANVGKSTLINALMGTDFAIVSDKPQTTRKNIRMIYTTEDFQIVFVDTPGLHLPKSKLGKQMVKNANSALNDVDLLLLVTDARDEKPAPSDVDVVERLSGSETPVILVINKVDLVQKERLLVLIDRLRALYPFTAMIPVSASKGEGVELIRTEILKYLPEGDQLYPEDMVTDQTERQLAADKIREKALRMLDKEVPHGIEVEIERFRHIEKKGLYEIYATIYCEKDSHKKIIIGKNGEILKKIGSSARIDIERMMEAKVYLNLWVKTRKDWRNDTLALRRLGYYD